MAPGLGPIYGLGLLERGQRAGYWQVFPGGEEWSYAGREQYYEGRQAALGVSPSVFWAGYYQARYGQEQPSWIRETQQRYEVGKAYWQAQQAWSPYAMGWSAARMGLYATPELGAGRTFGYPFAAATERLFVASQLQQYTRGMSYEQFMQTSGGWIGRPQNLAAELAVGGGLWTAAQSVAWGVRGGISELARGGGFGEGFLATIRRTLGVNVA